MILLYTWNIVNQLYFKKKQKQNKTKNNLWTLEFSSLEPFRNRMPGRVPGQKQA